MTDQRMNIEDVLAELTAVLDDEILNVQLCLERLNELRSAVIRRKEEELGGLLEMVKFQGDDYENIKKQRKDVFLKFARILDCPPDKVNLGFVLEKADPRYSRPIREKRDMLKNMTGKLGTEYSATVLLLNEFSRLNTMLIKSIFRPAKENTVYNSRGKSSLDCSGGLISCRF